MQALLGFAEDDEGFIDRPAIADGVDLLDRNDAAAMVGRTLGRYEIHELIGEGGVGAVYRASRADGEFDREIAVKVLKRGMDSAVILRRFRDERRILARLDHPNIARLLDGGMSDDGRPYFVMEYLEGIPLHEYCRTRNLTVRERLALFLPVCNAVEYSHRNLVIHRDLKATNILVTADGIPKLLDFGIAKLLDRDTSGEVVDATLAVDRMLTPDYASPEQILGQPITTAADVYSLGVLLYEVLADVRPFQLAGMSSAAMQKRVVEADAPRASAAAPADRSAEIAGDLDTIVLKAMHRSPERRYASAERLADDIRRYLAGLPVRARPDTPGYRLRKFVARHKGPVVTGTVASVALIVVAFAAVYQTAMAESKDREARKRFGEIRELAGGLLGDLDRALENLPGATPAREILARKVLHYLDGLARDQVRDASLQRELASAYERLGDILGGAKASNLGDTEGGLDCFRKALSILEPLPLDSVALLRDRARAHSKYSDGLAVIGQHTQALAQEQEALRLRQEWQRRAPADPAARRAVALSLQEIAGDLDRLGRFRDALANREQVVAIFEQLRALGVNDTSLPTVTALAYRRLGRSLMRVGRLDGAIARARAAIVIEREVIKAQPVNANAKSALAYSLTDLGVFHRMKGDPRTGLPFLREALAVRRLLSDADPRDWRASSLLATARLQHGRALLDAGDRAHAEAEINEALHVREDLHVRDPRNSGARGEVAEAAAALADVYAAGHDARRAVPLYEKAAEIYGDMQSRGSLTAELAAEPQRIAAALRKLRVSH